jgi:hypothetical protein
VSDPEKEHSLMVVADDVLARMPATRMVPSVYMSPLKLLFSMTEVTEIAVQAPINPPVGPLPREDMNPPITCTPESVVAPRGLATMPAVLALLVVLTFETVRSLNIRSFIDNWSAKPINPTTRFVSDELTTRLEIVCPLPSIEPLNASVCACPIGLKAMLDMSILDVIAKHLPFV